MDKYFDLCNRILRKQPYTLEELKDFFAEFVDKIKAPVELLSVLVNSNMAGVVRIDKVIQRYYEDTEIIFEDIFDRKGMLIYSFLFYPKTTAE